MTKVACAFTRSFQEVARDSALVRSWRKWSREVLALSSSARALLWESAASASLVSSSVVSVLMLAWRAAAREISLAVRARSFSAVT